MQETSFALTSTSRVGNGVAVVAETVREEVVQARLLPLILHLFNDVSTNCMPLETRTLDVAALKRKLQRQLHVHNTVLKPLLNSAVRASVSKL